MSSFRCATFSTIFAVRVSNQVETNHFAELIERCNLLYLFFYKSQRQQWLESRIFKSIYFKRLCHWVISTRINTQFDVDAFCFAMEFVVEWCELRLICSYLAYAKCLFFVFEHWRNRFIQSTERETKLKLNDNGLASCSTDKQHCRFRGISCKNDYK